MFEPNIENISTLIDLLPHSLLTSAPTTHFPVQLPLAFPSSLHHINFLTVTHLIHSIMTQTRHTRYFSETSTDPHETALRGVMGMFLGSDESWSPQNLLSAQSWKKGDINEEKLTEYFGIQVMREKDHESMKGVKVGGRWQPGVKLAEDIIGLLKRLGGKIPGKCVGEAVLGALKAAEDSVKGRKGPSRGTDFASKFCDEVLNFEPSLKDPYPHPSGTVIHALPLQLLQDLSVLFPLLDDIPLSIPRISDISNISPLPISLRLIAHLGLLSLPSDDDSPGTPDQNKLRPILSSVDVQNSFTQLTGDSDSLDSQPYVEIIELSRGSMLDLETVSVEICREMWGSARFSSLDQNDPEDKEWKQHMSMLDVERICCFMAEKMSEKKLGAEIVEAEGG